MGWQDKLWSKVDKSGDCWEWLGKLDRQGYGRHWRTGEGDRRAHRLAYELVKGPIPGGLDLDHLCRNTWCVRPDHLEPVTLRENIRRANPERTHCRHGHSLADAYIDWTPAGFPHKKCRVCVLARVRRRRERLAGGDRAAARS